jgi:acyl-coenzyme A synthetase/AMP-(fatty) acid ligase
LVFCVLDRSSGAENLGDQNFAACAKNQPRSSRRHVRRDVELRAFVAERLAAFKVPVKIVFLPDMLPRNPTGKLMKGELKRLFADARK